MLAILFLSNGLLTYLICYFRLQNERALSFFHGPISQLLSSEKKQVMFSSELNIFHFVYLTVVKNGDPLSIFIAVNYLVGQKNHF